MTPYYFPDPEHQDRFFGSLDPVCVDAREVRRLAREWGMDPEDLFAQLHPATDDEIAAHGSYATPLTRAEQAELFADAARMEELAFLADWPVSSLWGDPEDMAEIPQDRIAFLRRLWDAAHWSISTICCRAAVSMVELSQISLVPYRTLQRWASDDEKFAVRDRYYLLTLLGLLPRL